MAAHCGPAGGHQRAPLLIELTGEERRLLQEIRQRKAQLVQEIHQLKSEIKNISGNTPADNRSAIDGLSNHTTLVYDDDNDDSNHSVLDAGPDLTLRQSSWTVADSVDFVDQLQTNISWQLQAAHPVQPDLISRQPAAVAGQSTTDETTAATTASNTPLDLIYRLPTMRRKEKGHAHTLTTSTSGATDLMIDGSQFLSDVTDLLNHHSSDSRRQSFEWNQDNKTTTSTRRPVIPVKPMQSAQPPPRQQLPAPASQAMQFKKSCSEPDDHPSDSKLPKDQSERLNLFGQQQQMTSAKDRNQALLTGCIAFSLRPQQGIQFLIHAGLVQSTPDEVAKFLLHQPLLSKQAIGQFLGQTGNREVLQAFVRLHNWTKLDPVEALRRFLATFWLPGESQQIQRILEPFASHYCRSNGDQFDHEDQLFLLSYSLLMFNTLRHKPNAKARLSRSRFLAMNRGVRRSLLKRAYESVRKHPFQVPMDHPIVGQLKDELANAPSADGNKKSADQPSQVCRPARAFLTNNQMQGWLWKKSNHSWIPSAFIWRKRWFVLNDRCLYYFGQSDDVEPKGIIPLENVQVRIVHTTTTTTAASHVKPTFGFAYHQPDHCFEIRPAVGAGDQVKACKRNHKNRFVQNPQSHFSLGIDARLASDQSEKSSPPPPQQSHRQQLERWVRAMQAAITHNPYLEMLLARRRKHA